MVAGKVMNLSFSWASRFILNLGTEWSVTKHSKLKGSPGSTPECIKWNGNWVWSSAYSGKFHLIAFSELENENIFPFPLNALLLWNKNHHDYTVYCTCGGFFTTTLVLQSSLKKKTIQHVFIPKPLLHGFCPALCSARKLPPLQRVTGLLAG